MAFMIREEPPWSFLSSGWKRGARQSFRGPGWISADLHPFAALLRLTIARRWGARQNPPMPPSGGSVSVLREIDRSEAIFVA
jgi:hypothetical protein